SMSQLLNPGFWLVALLLALGLFGAGYAAGSKHASSECIASQAQAQQDAQAQIDETNTRREEVANERETSREQIRIVYRTIKEKAHETSVAADCGLDADGLRLWNAANAGKATPMRGQPDGRVPGTATGAIGEAAGSAGQPHRGDGAVQPVPRPAEKTGGVREQ
ncbi:MAG: hypothetical protein AB1722_10720, partial [Pseudomonadota bacterium]